MKSQIPTLEILRLEIPTLEILRLEIPTLEILRLEIPTLRPHFHTFTLFRFFIPSGMKKVR